MPGGPFPCRDAVRRGVVARATPVRCLDHRRAAVHDRRIVQTERDLVLMTVGGVSLDPVTKTPIVLLREETEDLTLPIWVGVLEATSVATQLEGVRMTRPMTHDLLRRVVEEVGATVARVVVTDLRESTFYAEIELQVAGRTHLVDARPSDAIALALRAGAPIFVAKDVLAASASEEAGTAPGEAPQADRSMDLSEVNREEWTDILENLDPDDFKYKM